MATGAGGAYDDDSVLVRALRRGDEQAFAWMLDRYDAPLWRAARGYVPTEAAADEVVQETWLGVLRGIDRFEQRSSVKTWLYRILMNIARSRGIRERRSVPFSSAAGPGDDGASPTFDPDRFRPDVAGEPYPGHWRSFPLDWEHEPEERLLAQETLGVVAAALDGLPAAQREVVLLRDVEGWSPEEVCAALELTGSNQRVLLHRGRSRLRRALEAYFEVAQEG
ncbi:MAG: RNA polymerase sigma factor [Acidimicrobiia bacterium]